MTPKVKNVLSIIIISSPEDRELRDELDAHLAALKRQAPVTVWHDGCLLPGEDRRDVFLKQVTSADVFLLVLTKDFLHSMQHESAELAQAIKRHGETTAIVVPIIARPCDWTNTIIGQFVALPSDTRPVASWPDRDEAWLDVISGIRRALADRFTFVRFSLNGSSRSVRPEAALREHMLTILAAIASAAIVLRFGIPALIVLACLALILLIARLLLRLVRDVSSKATGPDASTPASTPTIAPAGVAILASLGVGGLPIQCQWGLAGHLDRGQADNSALSVKGRSNVNDHDGQQASAAASSPLGTTAVVLQPRDAFSSSSALAVAPDGDKDCESQFDAGVARYRAAAASLAVCLPERRYGTGRHGASIDITGLRAVNPTSPGDNPVASWSVETCLRDGDDDLHCVTAGRGESAYDFARAPSPRNDDELLTTIGYGHVGSPPRAREWLLPIFFKNAIVCTSTMADLAVGSSGDPLEVFVFVFDEDLQAELAYEVRTEAWLQFRLPPGQRVSVRQGSVDNIWFHSNGDIEHFTLGNSRTELCRRCVCASAKEDISFATPLSGATE